MQDTRGYVNRTIREFEIQECLGEGGFATVYRARSTRYEQREAAVKLLFDHLARHPAIVERFRREAEAAFGLKHESIVHAYDYGPVDSTWFIAMEFVEGPTLRDVLLQQGGFNLAREDVDATRMYDEQAGDATLLRSLSSFYQPLDLGLVCQVLHDVCAALDYAHDQKILHRDLKPDNILISPEDRGKAMLTDFGIACLQEEERLTRTGSRLGSVAYMSPEQVLGKLTIDHRSDIYSLGIMLFELLTGTVPFVGVDSVVFTKHIQSPPPVPSTLRADLPAGVDDVVLGCLQKRPEDRYWCAGDVAQDFRKLVEPKPLSTIFAGKQTIITDAGQGADKASTSVINCPGCGNTFEVAEAGGECPTCLRFVTVPEGIAERERLEQEAAGFIAGLHLSPNLPMEVRAYEYERTAEPALLQQYNSAVARWSRLVGGGTVLPPYAQAGSGQAAEVLAAARRTWNLATLMESGPVSDWALSVDAKRRRRERVAELRAVAFQLLGLYHSSCAVAAGQAPGDMRRAYVAAATVCEQAIRELREKKIRLAIEAGLSVSAGLAAAIANYPDNRSAAEDVLAALPEVDVAASPPGRDADLSTLGGYCGAEEHAQERAARARVEAEAAIAAAQERILKRDAAYRSFEEQRAAEAARVEAAKAEIEVNRAAELRRFARQGLWVRLGVVVGPFILTLIFAAVMMAIKDWEGLAVPFFIALGTLTLPLAGAYLVAKVRSRGSAPGAGSPGPGRVAIEESQPDANGEDVDITARLEQAAQRIGEALPDELHLPADVRVERWGLDKFDAGPILVVIVGVWSFLFTALYFTGPGQEIHYYVPIPDGTVWAAIIWFVVLIAGWAAWIFFGTPRLLDGIYNTQRLKEWPWVAIISGLALALTTAYFAIAYVISVWRWTGWMRWPLMAAALGLIYLGTLSAGYVRRMSSAEGAADLYRSRELRRLRIEGQRQLDHLAEMQTGLIRGAASEIIRQLEVAAGQVEQIRLEANQLSARLLRTRMPEALFDVSDLDDALAEANAAFNAVQPPAVRSRPQRRIALDFAGKPEEG